MSLIPDSLAGRRNLALVVAGVLAALALRYPFLPLESEDHIGQLRWYAFIVENGYFAALRHDFADYNVTYLYLLTALAAVDLQPLAAVKAIAMPFDFALAYFVYKCVAHKVRDPNSAVPILAGLAALLAPTVVLNASAWGQSDAIYTTFLVACLYFLLAGRQAAALIAFGLAVSFKLQAVFLAPLLLWLVVKGQLRWCHLAWVPLVYLATCVPAGLVGRPWGELLLIYLDQADRHHRLTMNLPNLYAWIPRDYYDWWPLGVVFAACAVLFLTALVWKSDAKVSAELTVFLAAFSVIVVPYTLPKMHNRYYFPAEVVAIVLAFYLPRCWYLPVLLAVVSTHQYVVFLTSGDVIPVRLELLALLPTALLVALSWQLYMRLDAPWRPPFLKYRAPP